MSTNTDFNTWSNLMGLSKYFRRNFFITVVVIEIIALVFLVRELKLKDRELIECYGKILEQSQMKHSEVLEIKAQQILEIKQAMEKNEKLQNDILELAKEISKLETTIKVLKYENSNNK